MVFTGKKRQSNGRFLKQLDDFDQYIISGNTVNDRQENARVKEGTGEQDFTVVTSDNSSRSIEITVNCENLGMLF